MVDRKVIEAALNEFMEKSPLIEGVMAFRPDGSLVVGQTLVQLDKDKICEKALSVARDAATLSELIEKGKIAEISIRTESGYMIVMGKAGLIILAFMGTDAQPHLGFIRMDMAVALRKALGA